MKRKKFVNVVKVVKQGRLSIDRVVSSGSAQFSLLDEYRGYDHETEISAGNAWLAVSSPFVRYYCLRESSS